MSKPKTVVVNKDYAGSYDCSFNFGNPDVVSMFSYLVVKRGDLDINNAFLLRGKKDVKAYIAESERDGSIEDLLCVLPIGKPVKFEIRRVKE